MYRNLHSLLIPTLFQPLQICAGVCNTGTLDKVKEKDHMHIYFFSSLIKQHQVQSQSSVFSLQKQHVGTTLYTLSNILLANDIPQQSTFFIQSMY